MINSVDMDLRNDNKISLVLKDKTGFMKSTLSHIQNSLKSLAIKYKKSTICNYNFFSGLEEVIVHFLRLHFILIPNSLNVTVIYIHNKNRY